MSKSIKPAFLAVVAAASFATPALAADPTILVVDFERVFQDSAAAKNGTAALRAKYDGLLQQRRTAFQTAATAYNTQVEAIQKATKPGTQAAPTPAFQQAAQRAQQAQQQLQDTQEDVNQAAGYVRQQIIERATPLAEQIRGEKRATAVIAKGQVLASDASADVTSTLIQRLDSSFSSPSVTPPQQGAAPTATGTAPARPAATPARPATGR